MRAYGKTAGCPIYIFRTRHGQQKSIWSKKGEARSKGDKKCGGYFRGLTKEFDIQKCFSRSSVVNIEKGSTKTLMPSRPCS